MPTAGEVVLEVLPSTGKFGSALSTAIGPALTQAGRMLGQFAADSLDSFMEAEQAMSELNHAVGLSPNLTAAATDAFADQASALQSLTGVQDELILNADTILSRFGLSQEQIESAIPVVLDFARATGRDVPAAAEAVGKALLGNARALKDVGVDFDATGNRAKDFDTILGSLTDQVGGSAEAFGETLAGKMDKAKAKMDEFKESVGALEASFVLLLSGDIKGGASLWQEVVPATQEAMDAFAEFVNPVQDASTATGDLTAAQSAARTEMQHMAEATTEAAGATRDLYAAQLSLAGGLLGLEGNALSAADAQQQLADANAEVNKLQKAGKTGTEEYRDALADQDQAALDATQSQLSLVQSVADYVKENRGSKASTAEAISMIRQYGRDAGLTQGQINGLIGELGGLIREYGQVPASVHTDVTSTAGDAISDFERISGYINDLDGKQVNVYVYTHYKQDV